jgi:hypothetical protein
MTNVMGNRCSLFALRSWLFARRPIQGVILSAGGASPAESKDPYQRNAAREVAW